MNNRGFTLIELLAVIVVLGLIMTLAATSYTAISNSMKERQRDNLISQIEIAAARYAYDTGETITFVDTLVKEGYIESTEDDGSIEDPVNGGKLNCYIVEMEKASDYYDAEFIDNYNYEEESSGNCDTTKLKEKDSEIKITIKDASENEITYTADNWLSGSSFILEASFNSTASAMDCTLNDCVWTSTSGQEVNGSSIKISAKSILSSTYTFQYTIYTADEIIRYTASIDIKIDNEVPNIYENETTITDRNIPTSSKEVTIVASDGNGSGIAGYYLAAGDISCNNTSLESSYKDSTEWEVTSNGTHTICVKDNVGNIAKKTITISNIS